MGVNQLFHRGWPLNPAQAARHCNAPRADEFPDAVRFQQLLEGVYLVAAAGEVCDVANDNGGGQVVLSGTAAAIARAVAIAKARGVKRAVLLSVSAPFHCALMRPAADAMAEALDAAEIADPVLPVVANVLARPVGTAGEIVGCLVGQVCGTVRWRESVAWMAEAGVTRFVEVGAGKVLAGLVRRIAPEAAAESVGTPDDVARFLQARA